MLVQRPDDDQTRGWIAIHCRKRRAYPSGFYVVALVMANDVECTGEQDSGEDWLWGEALWGGVGKNTAPVLTKRLLLSVEPSLTRAQYAVATSVTLVFLGAFYLLFGVAVLAQRFEPFRKYVEPVATPDPEEIDSAVTEYSDSIPGHDERDAFRL
ncbi:hypothetical protein EVAR_79799_1 [Eumeta japonica]|uniref:Uncharacterized protein n=1 Tax=Eumeta variegata TaxID=151549 RepID=A0A4C1WTY1_EUMVA|nr:hypothetical protein EVAR_79799_1 [Eumeta japonica]